MRAYSDVCRSRRKTSVVRVEPNEFDAHVGSGTESADAESILIT